MVGVGAMVGGDVGIIVAEVIPAIETPSDCSDKRSIFLLKKPQQHER